jgi:hypothetical protein
MARLYQSGFELNSSKEFTLQSGAAATIDSSVKRTGAYSGKIASLSSATRAGFVVCFTGVSNGPFFFRVYLRITTLPSGDNTILSLINGTALTSTIAACIKLKSNGTLILCNATGTQIGSASPVLSTGTQYLIEFKYDKSPSAGSQVLEAKLNGTVFATDSTLTITNQVQSLVMGGNLQAESQTTGTWYFDDIAINDSSGSNQNGYPNKGAILHVQPNGAGDNTGFTIAGSSPAATNYGSVNEVAPDDAVTLVEATGINTIDDYTVPAFTDIGATDNIFTVTVGIRFSHPTAGGGNGAGITTRLKAVTGGTVDASAIIGSNNTGWFTNTSSGFIRPIYPLVDYFLPGTSTPWTKADLTASQIGVRIANTNIPKAQISALWLSVDFAPIDNFTSTLNDTVTPAETFIKETSREVSDSTSLSEVFIKSAQNILTDTISLTESLLKAIGKFVTDQITPTEDLSRTAVFNRELTDSISPISTISTIHNADVNIVDQIVPSEVLIKSHQKYVSDTVTLVETLVRSVTHRFTDAVTHVEVLIRAVSKSIYDQSVRSYLLQEDGSYLLQEDDSKLLIDGATIVYPETLDKIFGKVLTDSITLVEIFINSAIRKFPRSKLLLRIRSKITVLK